MGAGNLNIVIGEIIGAIAVIEGFFIYYSSTRERMLICKFVSDTLWLFNYLLLGGYTGALLNLIAMGREFVFYHRDKRTFARSPLWPVVFLLITLISPAVSLFSGNEGLYALLPAFGSMFGVLAFYQMKPNMTRTLGFCSQLLWLIYGICLLNYSAIVCNSVLLVSAVVGSIRAHVRGKKDAQADR